MNSLPVLLVIIGIAVVVIAAALLKRKFGKRPETPVERAGREGEEKAAKIIKSVLRPDDQLLLNVPIQYEKRRSEIDCLVVNQYGVFIIEVKNYTGVLQGKETDFEWIEHKEYESKKVKNPIAQGHRQMTILKDYLRSNHINVWIEYYGVLLACESPVESDRILVYIEDLDKVIHTQCGQRPLSQETIDSIIRVLG